MLASCGDRGEAFVFEKRKEEDEVQKMDVDVRIVDSSKCESGENKRGGEEEEAQSMFSCKWTLRGGTADALDLTWSADSQLVAVSYIDWRTIIYDVANGGLPLIAFEGKRGKGVLGASSGNGHTSFVQGVAFDTLSKWIVSVSADRTMCAWSAKKVAIKAKKARRRAQRRKFGRRVRSSIAAVQRAQRLA